MKLQLFLLLLILPMMLIPAFAGGAIDDDYYAVDGDIPETETISDIDLPREIDEVHAVKLTDVDGVEQFVMFWKPVIWFEFPVIDHLLEFEYIDNPGTWHIMNIELDTINSVSANYDALLDTNINLRVTAINENGLGIPSDPIQIVNNDELDVIRIDSIFGKNYDVNTPLVISGELFDPQYWMGEVRPIEIEIMKPLNYIGIDSFYLNPDNTFSYTLNFGDYFDDGLETGTYYIQLDHNREFFHFPFNYIAGVNKVDIVPEPEVLPIITEPDYREILLQLQQELSNLKASIASLQNTAISIEDRIIALLEE